MQDQRTRILGTTDLDRAVSRRAFIGGAMMYSALPAIRIAARMAAGENPQLEALAKAEMEKEGICGYLLARLPPAQGNPTTPAPTAPLSPGSGDSRHRPPLSSHL
jgi:hypothetical protein